MVQLYTSARRDMIMCPGTDSENLSGSEDRESVWPGLGKAFRKQVQLYCDFKDRCHILGQNAREDPGSLNKEKKIGMGVCGRPRRY